jgi:hypothetical protein
MSPNITPESCIIYDPSHLRIAASGSLWLLKDRDTPVLQVFARNDARAALAIARQYRAYCTIGHDLRAGVHYFRDDSTVPTREEEELLLAVGNRQLTPDSDDSACYVTQRDVIGEWRPLSPWLLQRLRQHSPGLVNCDDDPQRRDFLLGPVEWIKPHQEALIYYGFDLGIRRRYTAHKDFLGRWHVAATVMAFE